MFIIHLFSILLITIFTIALIKFSVFLQIFNFLYTFLSCNHFQCFLYLLPVKLKQS